MKKIPIMPILLLCCALLSGCAGRESEEGTWRGVQAGMDDLTAITERTEYYDIVSESEEIFHLDIGGEQPQRAIALTGMAHVLLGMQFYQGEPAQIWAEARSAEADIWLYRPDGSRELLIQGVPASYIFYRSSLVWRWYVSQEGDFYCWHNANYTISAPEAVDDASKVDAAFAKISPSGEIIYEETFQPSVSAADFCQSADGRCWLILNDDVKQSRTLAELDPNGRCYAAADNGQIADSLVEQQYLGTDSESLAIFNNTPSGGREIVKINPADGSQSCLLSFTGTSYLMDHGTMRLQDFRVLEDGSVQFLWLDSADGASGTLESLQMAKVNKIPIVVRGAFMSDPWITGLAAEFNRQSADYHVIIEDCGMGNDIDDFARLTSIQLAAGKGPDIIQAGFVQDYISGMMEKGVLEDLSPYMEQSGVQEADYFPFVFNIWKDGGHIYGINPSLYIVGCQMDERVLGSRKEPDINTLVDSLLSWENNAVFLSGKNSQGLLEMFLNGTDTLWGMVDWEKGSCDFSGELFAKMLEAAGRYGDDGRKGQLPAIAEWRIFWDIFKFDSTAEQESEGKVTCGVLFDDGCRWAVYSGETMAVNSSSSNKEGAWEFLLFLLGEEAQSYGENIPVSRSGFELWLEQQKARVADGKTVHMLIAVNGKITDAITYTAEDLTDEKIAEYRKAVEEAKPYPIRTAPILDIILDESENYFNGSKSAAQVSEIITNRVQVYLDEIR